MDLEVLYLAIPSLTADLKPTSSQLLWITDVYGFLLAGLLLTMGTLGDRIGRRRLLLIGAGAFGAASLLAAFSQSAGMLIAARAVLGVAGATLAPSTLALISNMFLDPAQRAFAIGVWVTCFSAGAAVGPLAGGVLLQFFWWGSVFLLAVPVMALLLLLGPTLLPEFRDPDAGRLDFVSAGMSLAAVLAAIYGLKRIAQSGLGWEPVIFVLAGLAIGFAFARRQRGLANPLIDLGLFRVPAFSASLLVNTLGIFVVAGMFLFIAQYLQLVLGFSPLVAGLWSLPSAGGLIAGSLLAAPLARRVSPAKAVVGGLALAAVGLGGLTQVGETSGLAIVVGCSVVFSLGIAAVVPLTTDIIVGSAPPEKAGAASGISETGTELGGALGIALLGSLGVAIYRNKVADTLPTGLPPGATETARDTLGGAVGVADHLPGPLGLELLDAAREAFVLALQLTAAASAALAVGTAVIVLVLLRDMGANPVAEEQIDRPQTSG
jgi:MFS transporter, DHA2 family, multidrug resistance protein